MFFPLGEKYLKSPSFEFLRYKDLCIAVKRFLELFLSSKIVQESVNPSVANKFSSAYAGDHACVPKLVSRETAKDSTSACRHGLARGAP
jgi:hypothetical protein